MIIECKAKGVLSIKKGQGSCVSSDKSEYINSNTLLFGENNKESLLKNIYWKHCYRCDIIYQHIYHMEVHLF